MSHPQHPRRRLPLQGARNLRDLGGYPGADGRTVRWDTLYRSGHLGKLTRRDVGLVDGLRLHTLIDLRSAEEKQRHPDRLPQGHALRVLELPILDEGNSAMLKDIRRRFEQNDFDDLDTVAVMHQTYRQFALDFSNEYRQFVHAVLAAEGKPILWHCTAGKDRAGFASALLLRLLGVDFAVIQQDYLLSGRYTHPDLSLLAMIFLTRGARPVRLMKPLWDVRREWITGAFDAIDEHWGSFDAYRRDALNLTDADIRQLHRTLLKD